jgi:DNA-binding beta-propeller fold protein YncE
VKNIAMPIRKGAHALRVAAVFVDCMEERKPMNAVKWLGCAVLAVVLIGAAALETVVAQSPAITTRKVPQFEVDPSFFKLPNGWKFAQVSSVACDLHDNVWVLQRPYTIYSDQKTGPSVMEFDPKGNYIKGWGGKDWGAGKGFQWPEEEHGISIDGNENVWITGNWNDDQIYKFTNDGRLIKQFGNSEGGHKKTNSDTENFWMPAAAVVYPKTNELFVADGYGNNRVIVVDAETGAFKRMWGAFGNAPQDIPPRQKDIRKETQGNDTRFGGAEQFRTQYFLDGGKEHPNQTVAGQPPYPKAPKLDPDDPGPPQFNLVHDLKISKDGLVYVADRRNMRVQIFTIDGKFLKSIFVDRWCADGCGGTNTQTAGSIGFSGDPEQRFLYVGSRTPAQIWVYDRKTMQPLYAFGRPGEAPGEFLSFHELTNDSKGNIYTADLMGYRAEKFVFKGAVSRQVNSDGLVVDSKGLVLVR